MTCAKKVCKECPFRRKSIEGYLGAASYDPQGFLAPHYHGDIKLPCHMTVDWGDGEGGLPIDEAPLCRGFVTFCKNSCKLPMNREVREAVEAIEKDIENIFHWPHEFINHHSEKD